ncbi:acetone carboxylase [Nocardioides sp.]|uniref:acetone carboxylase n=1 Tax=Nocardioides sp. TaxID=35761 RepID=UPI0026306635|nr:acetone carboxylase [Nocardioides sp.]
MGSLDEPDVCSGKGCRQPATHALLWNNPKIHTPERRKAWLACEEHLESLRSFLGSRGFIKDVVAHEQGADHTV